MGANWAKCSYTTPGCGGHCINHLLCLVKGSHFLPFHRCVYSIKGGASTPIPCAPLPYSILYSPMLKLRSVDRDSGDWWASRGLHQWEAAKCGCQEKQNQNIIVRCDLLSHSSASPLPPSSPSSHKPHSPPLTW